MRLHEIAGFRQLPRVTSDSKPFRQGGRLFVCESCGMAQKIADAEWLGETAEIYRDYEMYHQSAANDQPVFDPVSGRPSGRCEVLARRLLEAGVLPASGALLDVGAGSGAMLAAFSAACRGWTLFGLDLDDRKQQALAAIPRFERLFTVPIEQLPRQFDLVTLIHSLEHFPDPLTTLRALRGKIAPGGRLFVEVNNVERQPFDLVVADHLCHFTPRSLAFMAARAGYGAESARTDWVNKEISLLAAAEPGTSKSESSDARAAIGKVESEVAWLGGMLEHARALAEGARFGIFGTSVAATWLAAGLGDAVAFFVDEDPAREGRAHLGRPIFKPSQVPQGAIVYLAFAREIADAIRGRLAGLPATLAAPPAVVS
ncbi:MAG: class I SAM-dependent methyltransferase [Betaproteobacteria bacterium]|nr:class I SAM-dependent methyltransferase [Betaproteobacteria bacterium]